MRRGCEVRLTLPLSSLPRMARICVPRLLPRCKRLAQARYNICTHLTLRRAELSEGESSYHARYVPFSAVQSGRPSSVSYSLDEVSWALHSRHDGGLPGCLNAQTAGWT